MRAAVTSSTLTFDFYSVGGKHVDSYKLTQP